MLREGVNCLKRLACAGPLPIRLEFVAMELCPLDDTPMDAPWQLAAEDLAGEGDGCAVARIPRVKMRP